MAKLNAASERLQNLDFSSQSLERKDFEGCEFVQCLFADLSRVNFTDCHFKGCNFSNSKTQDTGLRNCYFSSCKLLGVNFSGSKDFTFEVHFEDCLMDYASFDKKKMYKSTFKRCKLHGANFTDTDLSKCRLTECDLYEALFSGTNLSGLDFTTNVNFIIDPEQNNIKRAKFALPGLPGLLQRHAIIVE